MMPRARLLVDPQGCQRQRTADHHELAVAQSVQQPRQHCRIGIARHREQHGVERRQRCRLGQRIDHRLPLDGAAIAQRQGSARCRARRPSAARRRPERDPMPAPMHQRGGGTTDQAAACDGEIHPAALRPTRP
jgi:hypothetical protein